MRKRQPVARRPETLRSIYSRMYGNEDRHDSPDISRTRMVRRTAAYLLSTDVESPVIVNLGSGAQALERQLRTSSVSGRTERQRRLRSMLSRTRMFSLDIADIPRRRLLDIDLTPHVQADSRHLPLGDRSVDLVLSNLSIDMLRASSEDFMDGLTEVNRVLVSSGKVDFTLHHPDVFAAKCGDFEAERRRPPQADYYNRTLPNPYFDSTLDIRAEFGAAGLHAHQVLLVGHGPDRWWEVAAVKV